MVRLLTLPEAADVLAVSISTVRRLVHTGELTPVKLRRSIRVTSDDVENLIRSKIVDSDVGSMEAGGQGN